VEGVNIVVITREKLNAKNVAELRYVHTENLNQFAKNVVVLPFVLTENIKQIANHVEAKMYANLNGVKPYQEIKNTKVIVSDVLSTCFLTDPIRETTKPKKNA